LLSERPRKGAIYWTGQPELQKDVKVRVTLWPTVSRSVHHGVEPHLGLMTRYELLFDIYCFVSVGRPLWREVGSVVCISHLNCFSSVILLLAFASYLISDCLWSAFFKSKRHKPSHHVKVAVHGEGAKDEVVVIPLESVLRLLLGSDNNEAVFPFWSVPRLVPGSNEVVFSFWSVPVLLPKGEEVRCYLLSERPHEINNIVTCTLWVNRVNKIRTLRGNGHARNNGRNCCCCCWLTALKIPTPPLTKEEAHRLIP
jgi:hypothetical protein